MRSTRVPRITKIQVEDISVEEVICDFDIGQAGQAAPKDLGAGVAVTGAAQVATKLVQDPDHFVEVRRFVRWHSVPGRDPHAE